MFVHWGGGFHIEVYHKSVKKTLFMFQQTWRTGLRDQFTWMKMASYVEAEKYIEYFNSHQIEKYNNHSWQQT